VGGPIRRLPGIRPMPTMSADKNPDRRIGNKNLNSYCATQRAAFYRKFPQLVNNFTSLTQTLVAHRKILGGSWLDFLC
jgi:hypothetical protein